MQRLKKCGDLAVLWANRWISISNSCLGRAYAIDFPRTLIEAWLRAKRNACRAYGWIRIRSMSISRDFRNTDANYWINL